jgi:hypothetical protein
VSHAGECGCMDSFAGAVGLVTLPCTCAKCSTRRIHVDEQDVVSISYWCSGGEAMPSRINLAEINEQYKLYPNDYSKGLLKTQQLYEDNKNGNDYVFGYLTELYFNLRGGKRIHWRNGVVNSRELQDPIKSVVIAALTRRPDPIEIEWSWGRGKSPGTIEKGVIVEYDSIKPKYYISVFGYRPPATEKAAERLARRAQRKNENRK